MNGDRQPKLQLAIDIFSLREAIAIIDRVYPLMDIIEIGTPLILSEGLGVVELLKKKFPNKKYLVDLKLMDGGYNISVAAYKRGADIVTVLARANNRTITLAVDAAKEWNKRVMIDMINEINLVDRAMELEKLGVSILCVHTPYDCRDAAVNPLSEIEVLRPHVNCLLAIAGGIKFEQVSKAVYAGADIVVVGGEIISSSDQRGMAQKIIDAMSKVNR